MIYALAHACYSVLLTYGHDSLHNSKLKDQSDNIHKRVLLWKPGKPGNASFRPNQFYSILLK